MKTEYYYLNITHTFNSSVTPHAGHLEEFSAESLDDAVLEGLRRIREIHNNPEAGNIIAASLHKFGGEISISSHPSKRLLVGKIYQPMEWAK